MQQLLREKVFNVGYAETRTHATSAESSIADLLSQFLEGRFGVAFITSLLSFVLLYT